jgi:hypothetical protein
MLRYALMATVLLAPAASLAQAVDPAAVAQSGVLRGTMEGHAQRDRARQRGERAQPALSDACRNAWKRRDQMSREERRRLYDRCPR